MQKAQTATSCLLEYQVLPRPVQCHCAQFMGFKDWILNSFTAEVQLYSLIKGKYLVV